MVLPDHGFKDVENVGEQIGLPFGAIAWRGIDKPKSEGRPSWRAVGIEDPDREIAQDAAVDDIAFTYGKIKV